MVGVSKRDNGVRIDVVVFLFIFYIQSTVSIWHGSQELPRSKSKS
jgi:hypothetical protein